MLRQRSCDGLPGRARSLSVALVAAQVASFAPMRAGAQCVPGWLTGSELAGFDGQVRAFKVLPDGSLLAGGLFRFGQPSPHGYIARWNNHAWTLVEPGLSDGNNSYPQTFALMPNGDLVVGGAIFSIAGVAVNGVARWDGSAWHALGSGTNFRVNALALLPNGDLVAGGLFWMAGGVPANNIARWDGAAWWPMGAGLNRTVEGLVVLSNGDVIAAGSFDAVPGGIGVNHVARWDGTQWLALGNGTSGTVWSVMVMPNGDVVAGGQFVFAGTVAASNIARWNGTAWSALGAGVNGKVDALAALPSGGLAAGGLFSSAGGVEARNVARWDGAAWSALGGGTNAEVYALAALPGGEVVAGGTFSTIGGFPSAYIARYSFDPPAPWVARSPEGATACSGVARTFSVAATGAAPLTYQWQIEDGADQWVALSLTDVTLSCGGSARVMYAGGPVQQVTISACAGVGTYRVRAVVMSPCGSTVTEAALFVISSADFNHDGDSGTDGDIETFFACLAGNCCAACGPADFDGDGDGGTDADIEAFFRVLGGGTC